MARSKKTNEVSKLSFEEAIRELTGIVGAIEQGEVSLQDSLEQYEKGMALIKHCRGILQTAERRIEEISIAGEPTDEGDVQEASDEDEADEDGQSSDDPTSPDGPGLYD